MRQDRRGDADAGVGDGKAQPRAVVSLLQGADTQPDLALVGELDGIADQVGQDLLQAQGVADQGAVGQRRGVGGEAQALGPGGRPQEGVDLVQQRGQDEGPGLQLNLPGLDLGEVENFVEQ